MTIPNAIQRHSSHPSPISSTPARTQAQDRSYRPAVDLLESPDAFIIVADLPGADPDLIAIDVEPGLLTLDAPVNPDGRAGSTMSRREYGVGNYHRRFRIDDSIDVARIRAASRDGTLTIELPKRDDARRVRVPVTVTSPSRLKD